MPVDSKYPNILHCAVCRNVWKKQEGKPLPKRCASLKCKSTMWRDGIDHRKHVQDYDIRVAGDGMAGHAASRIRNYPNLGRLVGTQPQVVVNL